VKKYVDYRGKEESPEAFRYRVWEVALKFGAKEAKAADPGYCRALLTSR